MKHVAIFGCGIGGRRACLHLRSKYKVAAFLDNNRKVHGSRLLGLPVCDPEIYDYNQVEHVFIASMYFDEILVQLLMLGVPSSKIECVSEGILMRESPNTLDGWFAFSGSFNLLRRAFYVPFRFLR